jgi:hypothetical protein
MDDLGESLPLSFAEARPVKTLLINAGMKYGGHLLKKIPDGPMRVRAGYWAARAKYDSTGYACTPFCPNAQDDP